MRALYFSASVITLTGGDTTADGEPCEPGHGYSEQDGFWNPDGDYWTVHPSRDDVTPDIYPDDSPLSPAQWLAEQVAGRLGDLDYIDGNTFGGARTAIEPGRLTGPDADQPGAVAGTRTFLGDVFAANRMRTAPAGTRTVTATAHAHGFTDTELADAATLLDPDTATPGLDWAHPSSMSGPEPISGSGPFAHARKGAPSDVESDPAKPWLGRLDLLGRRLVSSRR